MRGWWASGSRKACLEWHLDAACLPPTTQVDTAVLKSTVEQVRGSSTLLAFVPAIVLVQAHVCTVG
jgi:hypothetical protein